MLNLAWRLIHLIILLALCVVFLGAWTRINNAGLSCPDWPGCYGFMVMPEHQTGLDIAQQRYPETPIELSKTWLEMGHRYLAGGLGLLIMLLAILGYKLRSQPHFPSQLCFALAALVVVQALFGMWTVTLKLYPPIVVLHLLGGMLTLTLSFIIYSRIKALKSDAQQHVKGLKSLVQFALAVLLLQILLGGWTSANYAGPSCSGWFDCGFHSTADLDYRQGFDPFVTVGPNYEGGLLPAEARAAIQVVHRLGAVLVAGVLAVLITQLWRYQHLRHFAYLLSGLLVVQLIVGVLNVAMAVPNSLAMLHHALAVGLLVVSLLIYGNTAAVPASDQKLSRGESYEYI